MHARVGDRLHIHTNQTAAPDTYGQIIETRGADGAPPYLVEFPGGHTRLVFPGPDAVVEPTQPGSHTAAHGTRRGRHLHTRTGW